MFKQNQAPFIDKKSEIRSEKKNYLSSINTSDITDNKTFWKTVKPFFTDETTKKIKNLK